MSAIKNLSTVCLLAFLLTSCRPSVPGEEYVHQKVPIEIETGKAVSVELHLGNYGVNDVGIRCPPEVWSALTNGTNLPKVRLKSSNKESTMIYGIEPGGSPAGLLYVISNVHYLFEISGGDYAKASVEITFPSAPPGVTHAEIVVSKSPAETGL